MAHAVTLTLRSTQTVLDNWDSYEITQDMFAVGAPWAFTLWYSGADDSAWRRMLAEVRLGDTVVIAIDDAPQLTGRIEARLVQATRAGAALVISGRDMAGPAMDWDADPRTVLRQRPLEDVLRALLEPLGIPVVIGANADAAREVQSRARPGHRGATAPSTRRRRRKTVDLSHARPGERVWQVVESILRRLGYMAWVAPATNGALALVVDAPDYAQAPLYRFERRFAGDGAVTRESDILESQLEAQIRDIPTVVYAFGRAPRGDQLPARHVAGRANGGLYRKDADPFLARARADAAAYAGGLRLATPGVRQALPTAIAGKNTPAVLPPLGEAPPAAATPAASATLTTRLPYRNDGLASSELVMSPLPPQPRFLHSKRALDAATGAQEAHRVIAEAMRRFRTYTITVAGHGQTIEGARRLYAVNTMATVHDPLSEVTEAMLVHRVTFTGGRDENAQRTRLVLGTRGAVVLEPEEP